MKHLRYAFSLIALLTGLNAQASIDGCAVPVTNDKRTKIYFSNGVGNSYEDAVRSRNQLINAYADALEERIGRDEMLEWGLAYNESQGFIIDIVQVFRQKMQEENIEGNPYLLYTMAEGGYSSEAIAAIFGQPVLNELGELIEIASSASAATMFVNIDQNRVESRHVSAYMNDLAAGKRVLVVAHSQGNLFTNSALEEVLERNPEYAESIRQVGVASPAFRIVNGDFTKAGDSFDDYVTDKNDLIIIKSLGLVEQVLPHNVDNSGDPNYPGIFSSKHGFVDYYLNSTTSRKAIDEVVKRVFGQLSYPTKIAGEGAIRATLTWDIQPDVDLHVYEPDGSHVYYDDKEGSSGTLDVDDKLSYGPENYFVECNDIEEGTYSIGVNYFFGFFSSEAILTVTTGDSNVYGPKRIVLTERRGREGSTDPYIIYTVDVSENDDGNAVYSVENVCNTYASNPPDLCQVVTPYTNGQGPQTLPSLTGQDVYAPGNFIKD
jgi:hypothetical protein